MYSGGTVTISKSAGELILTMFGGSLQSTSSRDTYTRDMFPQFKWPFDELVSASATNKLLVLDAGVELGVGVSIEVNLPVTLSRLPAMGVTITFPAHNFLMEPVVCTMTIGPNDAGVMVRNV